MNERGVGAAGSRTAPDIHENQEALSVAKRGKLCVETRRAARAQMVRVTNMNDDDSGDEAEARHLLEKRRTQAKYDAVRSESDKSVVETVAEPGLMNFFGHPTKTGVARHEGSPRLRAIVIGPSRRELLICPRVWPRVCPVKRKL